MHLRTNEVTSLGPNQPVAYQALINNLIANRRDNSARVKNRQIRKIHKVQMIRTLTGTNERRGEAKSLDK